MSQSLEIGALATSCRWLWLSPNAASVCVPSRRRGGVGLKRNVRSLRCQVKQTFPLYIARCAGANPVARELKLELRRRPAFPTTGALQDDKVVGPFLRKLGWDNGALSTDAALERRGNHARNAQLEVDAARVECRNWICQRCPW